jgi:DNA-binding CsgD family transcriptional regulator
LGVLVLFVRTERLAEILNSELYVDGEPEEGAVGNYFNLLLHKEGTILSSPIKSQVGQELKQSFEGSAPFEKLLASGKDAGENFIDWKGTKLLLNFQRLANTDFYLVETSTPVKSPKFALTVVLFAALAVAALAALTWKRSRPIPDRRNPSWMKTIPPRELEILLLVAEGKSNKEIAYNLNLKEQTVKNYIRSLYEKIGVHDRVSASLLVNKFDLGRSHTAGEKAGEDERFSEEKTL